MQGTYGLLLPALAHSTATMRRIGEAKRGSKASEEEGRRPIYIFLAARASVVVGSACRGRIAKQQHDDVNSTMYTKQALIRNLNDMINVWVIVIAADTKSYYQLAIV